MSSAHETPAGSAAVKQPRTVPTDGTSVCDSGDRVRVVTWNVARSSGPRRAQQLQHLLTLGADVALLQESLSFRNLLPPGYVWFRSATPSGWGCAVLLGPRLTDARQGVDLKPHRPGRTVLVEARLDGQLVSIACVHPQARRSKTASGSSSAKWVRDLEGELQGRPAIVGGDWNVGPGVGDSAGFRAAIEAAKWTDCCSVNQPHSATHRHNSGSEWIIDHVFTRGFDSLPPEVRVDTSVELSDHWPLVVTWPNGLVARPGGHVSEPIPPTSDATTYRSRVLNTAPTAQHSPRGESPYRSLSIRRGRPLLKELSNSSDHRFESVAGPGTGASSRPGRMEWCGSNSGRRRGPRSTAVEQHQVAHSGGGGRDPSGNPRPAHQ